MKAFKYLMVLPAVLLAATLSAAPSSREALQAFPGSINQPGPDASSELTRLKSALTIDVTTSGLDATSPYTLWAVIFNRPEFCQSVPCGVGDLPVSPGHDPRVDASIVFAGGGVSEADGTGRFLGRVRKAHGQALGERLFGTGSLDTRRAEIHVVVRGHGYPPATELFAAIASFAGGCSAENVCSDQQFAVHRAAHGVH